MEVRSDVRRTDTNRPAPEDEEPSEDTFERDFRRDALNRLFTELSKLVEQQRRGRRRITELRGLGKEIWQGVDAQEYVDAERES
jgi:hypothetical protein